MQLLNIFPLIWAGVFVVIHIYFVIRSNKNNNSQSK